MARASFEETERVLLDVLEKVSPKTRELLIADLFSQGLGVDFMHNKIVKIELNLSTGR